MNEERRARTRNWLDIAATTASAACLIHCLVLPVAIALLPALAVWLTLPESVHVWALSFAVPTSLCALAIGYHGHRRCQPMAIALFGLTLLALGAFAFPGGAVETQFSIAGALMVALAHYLNWRESRRDCARV